METRGFLYLDHSVFHRFREARTGSCSRPRPFSELATFSAAALQRHPGLISRTVAGSVTAPPRCCRRVHTDRVRARFHMEQTVIALRFAVAMCIHRSSPAGNTFSITVTCVIGERAASGDWIWHVLPIRRDLAAGAAQSKRRGRTQTTDIRSPCKVQRVLYRGDNRAH